MSLLSREIEYFLRICATGNLARAAASLDLTQPALSRCVQRLERRYDAKLFVRAPRGVELTPVGEALRGRIEAVRMALDDAEKEVVQLSAGKAGRVRIGVGLTLTALVSSALFPRLINDRPAAQVQFHSAFNDELYELIQRGKLDFAICGLLGKAPPGLETRVLFADDLGVVVRNGHPLLKKRKPSMQDLMVYRNVATPQGVGARQIADERLFRQSGAPPLHAIETNSLDTILQIVSTTDLYSLAPWDRALQQQWGARVKQLNIPELTIQRTVGLVMREKAFLSPICQYAIELLGRSLHK